MMILRLRLVIIRELRLMICEAIIDVISERGDTATKGGESRGGGGGAGDAERRSIGDRRQEGPDAFVELEGDVLEEVLLGDDALELSFGEDDDVAEAKGSEHAEDEAERGAGTDLDGGGVDLGLHVDEELMAVLGGLDLELGEEARGVLGEALLAGLLDEAHDLEPGDVLEEDGVVGENGEARVEVGLDEGAERADGVAGVGEGDDLLGAHDGAGDGVKLVVGLVVDEGKLVEEDELVVDAVPAEAVADPLGHHDGHHDGDDEGGVSGELEDDDDQGDGDAGEAAEAGGSADQRVGAW